MVSGASRDSKEEKAMLTLGSFILAGHATTVEDTLTQPVTVSGYYKGKNGYRYYVGWNNGQMFVGPIGYSAEYLLAEREYEELYGVIDSEEKSNCGLKFIADKLGIRY